MPGPAALRQNRPMAAPSESVPLAPVLPDLVERLIASPTLLVALETPRPEAVLDQLRQAALRGGRAIYHYVPAVGIGSLREPGVHVPGTRSPFDAIRHIDASNHFGIYVFHPVSSLGLAAGSVVLTRILQMIETPQAADSPKRIVLMDRYVPVEATLDRAVTRIFDRPSPSSLRLRGGRWVE